jgi:hypothetical protein
MGLLQCKPCPPGPGVGGTGNPLDLQNAQPPATAGHGSPGDNKILDGAGSVSIGREGKAFDVDNTGRDGRGSWYSEEEMEVMLAKYRSKWGSCEYPMPRDSRYKLSFAPTMWQFWGSDPKKKTFRRKPMVLHAEAPVQLAMEQFRARKMEAQNKLEPGHFNMASYLGEYGLLADALARPHRHYQLQNSRHKSGPVVMANCG